MTVIYIDRVFALNLALDYMLLLICARLAGTPLRRLRFLLCAARLAPPRAAALRHFAPREELF